MPFPLHKVPTGLLGLLNAKVNGANPSLYSEQVVPTLETRDMYGLANREMLDVSVGAQAGPASQIWTVPSGEIWRVLHASMFIVLPVGVTPTDNVSATTFLRGPPNLTGLRLDFQQQLLGDLGTLPLTEAFAMLSYAKVDMLLAPGWSIAVSAGVTLTGVETYSFSARAMIERYPT